jgi:hypothetical protein
MIAAVVWIMIQSSAISRTTGKVTAQPPASEKKLQLLPVMLSLL